MIFEEQFPVPKYTVASKIGNSVISLLWQLRCRCNPDHNKFSSLSNTTVVAIFPKLCLWRRSLCSNLGGTDPEKLYRATLIIPSKNWKQYWVMQNLVRRQTKFNSYEQYEIDQSLETPQYSLMHRLCLPPIVTLIWKQMKCRPQDPRKTRT